MSYGAWGSYPHAYGGAESDAERIWRELRKLVGERGPGPVDGLEDLWRQCKAKTIAMALAAYERAALQAFPQTATDHLPLFERMLGVGAEGALTEHERRTNVVAAYTRELGADGPTLRDALQAIDPALDVVTLDHANVPVSQLGKMFAPRGNVPNYGSRKSTTRPAYSGHHVLRVKYALSGGATVIPADVRARVAKLLNESLPGWMDWRLTTGRGFFLDGGPSGTSRLDSTTFGS